MHAVHNHSDFSALDGLSKPEEIAARVLQTGMKGAFVTDHGVIAGWRSFQKAMNGSGLYAGFGIEAYQARTHRTVKPEGGKKRDQSHLILLAKNDIGVRNIMRMSYQANKDGYYYVPRVDWELLEEFKEGVIATSACVAGLTAKGLVNDDLNDLHRFRKIFGEDFFLEIHTYSPDKIMTRVGDGDETTTQRQINEGLVSVAQQFGVPMVYANDAHYACKGDWPYHETLMAANMNKSLGDETRMHHDKPCLYIMNEEDARAALSYLPSGVVDEAIANSDLIAERCATVSLPEPGKHLPVFVPKTATKETNASHLTRLVEEGCLARYGEITPEIEERAVYELRTIIDAGLVDYFLITYDFCMAADERGIGRGPGRGSVGGSIIAYAIGITDVDPLKYNLYFERFYNAGRDEGLPDIDIDFSKRDRHKIDDYLMERWGKYNVIPIGNHITMKPLACLQKLTKPFDMDYAVVDDIKRIVREVPDIEILSADQIGWRMGPGIKAAVLEEHQIVNGELVVVPSAVSEKLKPYMDRFPDYFDAVERLTGRISGYGIHASAIVISDVDIRDILPVMLRTDDDAGTSGKKTLVTQVEMREVEAMGFPKFDRLGLKTIDILEEVRESLNEPVDFYRRIDWDAQPEEMWKLVDRGLTLGLFQVEQGMAKKIGKRLKPRNIEDCAAIVALNRPGPLRSGATERFLLCREGLATPVIQHEILEPILASTYGEFLYQEQVIAYFSALGYDAKEADGIRKMLGKKMVVKMQEELPNYLDKALQVMDNKTAMKVWEQILEFSLYSFNKAHAVAYGYILARAIFAKFFYSSQFIMAAIHEAADQEGVGGLVREALRMDLDTRAPDINRSQIEMANINDTIYFGLSEVKNVGAAASRWVIANRPYASYQDFLDKHAAAQEAWEVTKDGRSPKQTVTTRSIQCLRDAGAFDDTDPRTKHSTKKLSEMQGDLLGVSFYNPIAHIIEDNADELTNLNDYADLEDVVYFGEVIPVPGHITHIKKTVTKKGKNPGSEMGIVKIEWNGEEVEFPVFPNKWEPFKNWFLKEGNVGIFNLRIKDGGVYFEGGQKLVAAEAASGGTE
jgi:DNA polymerase-3 subunit alpha